MIRAILFDMGGTLDGDGQHWLERFLALYRDFGVDLPRETVRGAFDEAERQAAKSEETMGADFGRMLQLYVRWQLAHLALEDPALEKHLIDGFSAPVRTAATANVQLLAALADRGFELGVVSNGCGNVEALCIDFGYAPFLSVIVDSRLIGISKPDPAIFSFAADQLDREPETILMVGDSFERDVVPAKKIGMKTAWLEGNESRPCPDASLIDFRLRRLTDLPGLLLPLTASVG